MKVLVAVVLAVLMVGCSTTDGFIEGQIRGGAFSFTPSSSPDYDYNVVIKRVFDFGIDTSKPEDRIKVMKKMMGHLCPNPIVIHEDYVDQGKASLTGVKFGTYLLKVSCPK